MVFKSLDWLKDLDGRSFKFDRLNKDLLLNIYITCVTKKIVDVTFNDNNQIDWLCYCYTLTLVDDSEVMVYVSTEVD